MNEKIYIDGCYWNNNPNFHLSDSHWKAHHLYSLLGPIAKSILPRKQIKISEVGCGAGGVLSTFIEFMNERGFECEGVGYDISPAAIDKAKLLFPNIKFKVTDITQINEGFDLLLLVDILEHVNIPADILNRCFELSPIIIIHLPLDNNFWGKLLRGKGYYEYLRNDRGHIHYFTKRAAFKLVNSINAHVLTWKYTKWGIENDLDKSKSGKFVRFLRHIGFRLNMNVSVRLLGGASIAMVCCQNKEIINRISARAACFTKDSI